MCESARWAGRWAVIPGPIGVREAHLREDLRDLRICLAARHWRAGGGQAAPRVSRRADTHVHGRGHACGNALDAQRAGGSRRYGASSADNVAASAVVYSLPRGVKLRALRATGAAGTLPGGLIIGTAPSLAAVFVGGGEHTQEPRGERRAATRKKKNTRRRLGASTRHWRITTTRSTTRSTAGPPCAPRRPEGPPPRARRC